MRTDTAPPSASRRLLACCGFAVCWLGAAVTGGQATLSDGPVGVLRVEQRGAGSAPGRPELATQSVDSRPADPALEAGSVIGEFRR